MNYPNKYPQLCYNHLPCSLIDNQQYIGEKNQDPVFIEKCLNSYMENCWPLDSNISYHCKGYNIHQRINNGHFIKAKVRYYKTRNALRNDKLKQYYSAYNNLAVFNGKGEYLPLEKHKYQ